MQIDRISHSVSVLPTALIASSLLLLSASFLTAQTTPVPTPAPAAPTAPASSVPKDPRDVPHLTLIKTGWSSKDELIVGVRLHAPSAGMELGTIKGEIKDDANGNELNTLEVNAFSMGTAYLIDSYTGDRIDPQPQLPRKPYFGPMDVVAGLAPGTNITLGVAFPTPPTPPLDDKGKPQAYKLTLHVPLDGIKPIPVNLKAR